MEEESEKTRDARLEAWGRDDFSIFKPKKVQQSTETVEMEVLSILMAYYLGFFTAFHSTLCFVWIIPVSGEYVFSKYFT